MKNGKGIYFKVGIICNLTEYGRLRIDVNLVKLMSCKNIKKTLIQRNLYELLV